MPWNDCRIMDCTVASPSGSPLSSWVLSSGMQHATCQACGAAAAMTLGVLSRLAAHLSCIGGRSRARNLGRRSLQQTGESHTMHDM